MPGEAASAQDGKGRSREVELHKELATLLMLLGAVAAISIGFTLVYLSFVLFPRGDESIQLFLLRQVGSGILVAGVISALLHLLYVRAYRRFENTMNSFLRNDVLQQFSDLRREIGGQTQRLYDASSSLNAMHISGVKRFYKSRQEAAPDLERDLADPQVTRIHVIGISMNDFVSNDATPLRQVWRVVEEYITRQRTVTNAEKKLDVKVLIIDPDSMGAHLRSKAERRDEYEPANRLDAHVRTIGIESLAKFRQLAIDHNKTDSEHTVNLDFRLYRVAPSFFLINTNLVSYIQPYYFWSSRSSERYVPIFSCGAVEGEGHDRNLHAGMEPHFDWIWNHASVDPLDSTRGHAVGVDKMAYLSGAINVYVDAAKGKARILALLRSQTHQHLDIQGVSLNTFFVRGPVFQAIGRLLQRGGPNIRILLLDPDCEQAHIRSYREYLITTRNPETTFETYLRSGEHQRSDLYQHTWATIRALQLKMVDTHAAGIPDALQVRLYRSAPSCFVLMNENSALVEQYHYGKVVPEGRGIPTHLGADMPLVEYQHVRIRPTTDESIDDAPRPEDVLIEPYDQLRDSYELLKTNFAYVWDKCSRPIEKLVVCDDHEAHTTTENIPQQFAQNGAAQVAGAVDPAVRPDSAQASESPGMTD